MLVPFEHILVTGGCGFIGSNFIRHALNQNSSLHITNLDLLTYSGNPENLKDVVSGSGCDSRYHFVRADIGDENFISQILCSDLDANGRPSIDAVVHFAAESHVDRSIIGSIPFVRTNVLGTSTLIETCRVVLDMLPSHFRFIHVSIDEVYGSLGASDPPFSKNTPLAPNSPYAASKAGSDLLVRSYCRTFDFPAIITRCSNNYGPFQYPEKFIPLMVTMAMCGAPLPVYGDGMNIRDWIHVEDHCAALWAVLRDGRLGTCYNIGGESETTNLEIVRNVVATLGKPESLITFVTDRLGHDQRYAMNIDRIRHDVGWRPTISFHTGLRSTIEWYLQNEDWWRPLLSESKRVADTIYRT